MNLTKKKKKLAKYVARVLDSMVAEPMVREKAEISRNRFLCAQQQQNRIILVMQAEKWIMESLEASVPMYVIEGFRHVIRVVTQDFIGVAIGITAVC